MNEKDVFHAEIADVVIPEQQIACEVVEKKPVDIPLDIVVPIAQQTP
jgi:hypothetical protein